MAAHVLSQLYIGIIYIHTTWKIYASNISAVISFIDLITIN